MNKKPWANPGLAASAAPPSTIRSASARSSKLRGYGPAKHRAKPQFL
jgi:hypothetical protein